MARLTLNLLGWTFDWSIEPTAEAEDEGGALNGGTCASTPITFLPQQATPAEWQPPERTLPWDEPLEERR